MLLIISSFNIYFSMVLDLPWRVIPPSKVVSISVWWKLYKGLKKSTREHQALSNFTVGQP